MRSKEIKTVIFGDLQHWDLNTKINEWLEENDVEVIDIKLIQKIHISLSLTRQYIART